MKITYRSKGLGDTIDKITTVTGIKQVAKTVSKVVTGNEDCGCSKRKDALNEMFPYKEKE